MDPNLFFVRLNPDIDEVKDTKLMRGYDRMNLSGQYKFNQLKEEIHTELERSTFPSTIFNTINNIARVINAIRDTKGVHWAQTVIDNGQPVFTPVEQQRYTELLKPYVSSILEFFEESHDGQRGGANPTMHAPGPASVSGPVPAVVPAVVAAPASASVPVAQNAVAQKAAAPVQVPAVVSGSQPMPVKLAVNSGSAPMSVSLMAYPTVPATAPVPAIVAEPSKIQQKANHLVDKLSDKLKSIDISNFTPDVLFEKVISSYQNINRKMNDAMEVVHFEKHLDEEPDIPMGGIPISPRFIIFLIYYVLDITRVAVSVYGNETGRKLLSIIISILDLVRGDWKKAILTFIGYYGSSPLLIGQAFKTYLTVIQMLSPTIQIKIPYFMYDSAKSMLFGVLLSIIQIGAPKPIRDKLGIILLKLSDVKHKIDNNFKAIVPPLYPRPDYLDVNFTDLNSLQAVLDDPVYVCSTEHQEAVEELIQSAKEDKSAEGGSALIQLILSFMRYPHTSGMKKFLCGKNPSKTYVQLLVAEGIERTEKEGRDGEPNNQVRVPSSTELLQMQQQPQQFPSQPHPLVLRAQQQQQQLQQQQHGGNRTTKRVLRSSKPLPPGSPPNHE